MKILALLGEQLRQTRLERRFSQAQVAKRIGRDPARVSEFERELRVNRMGRDRLTLLADMCDALGLVPLLVPTSKLEKVRGIIDESANDSKTVADRAFDELFVDLGDEGQD